MHRIAIDVFWQVVATYVALVILRETAIVVAPFAPSVARAIEFGIGTGGHGAGTGA